MGSDGDRRHESNLQNNEEREEMLFERSLPLFDNIEPTVPSNGSLMSRLRKVFSNKLIFLPVATFVMILLSILISYVVAASQGHVHWYFPYISHTAIYAPERCIFAQMMNIGALMLAANVYVRYLQMHEYLTLNAAPSMHKCINSGTKIIGFISAFGLSIVANFQTFDMQAVHYTGAFSAFVLGTLYCIAQTFLSVKYTRRTKVTVIQIANSILLTICLIIFIASKSVYKVKDSRGHGTKHDTLRDVYLVSTISEWLTALFMITFVLTFCKDFSNISMKLLSVTVKNEVLATQNLVHSSGQNGTSAV